MVEFLVKRFIPNWEKTADPQVRTAYGRLAGIVGIICNLLLFAGKFLAGTIFGSVAVTADAVNNLSDASSNIVSIMGFWLGSRPADHDHPFGHARYEYLAGLGVSVMILVIGLQLALESLKKLVTPTPVAFSWLTIGVLVASILVKLWMSLFNSRMGKIIHSETLMATAADSRNDVLSTAGVLAAVILTRLTGFDRIDGFMGLAVTAFILISGLGLVRDTLSPLLGKKPDPELVAHIRDKILAYDGVLGIHDLMVHDYGPGQQFASVHVEVPADQNVLDCHDMIDNIEKDFLEQDHLQLTIHYDPIVTNDPMVNRLKGILLLAAQEINSQITIHDLRIVPGTSHTNVVFDCVLPDQPPLNEEEIRTRLTQAVQKEFPSYRCVITLERDFAQ